MPYLTTTTILQYNKDHDYHSHLFNFVLDISAQPTVTAVQDDPTSIKVYWSPTSNATEYSIKFNSNGGYSGNVNVDANTTNYTLTGFYNGDIYYISVAATFPNSTNVYIYARPVHLSK